MKFSDVTNAAKVLYRWRKGETYGTALLALALAVATAVGSPALLGLSLLLAVIGNAVRLVYRESGIQRDQRKADAWWSEYQPVFHSAVLDPTNLAEWERNLLANAEADVKNAES